jgi:phenylacetate-coenzyme A ligase PaaK-like adenylate-forming protein
VIIWTDYDRLSKREIQSRQAGILNKFLKEQLLNYSTHYRELFKNAGLKADDIRTIADLRKIPFTTKKDIAPTPDDPKRPTRLILQPDPETYRSTLTLRKKLGLVKNRFISGREVREQVLDEYMPVQFIATTGRTALPTPFIYTNRDMIKFKAAAKRLFMKSGIRRDSDIIMNVFPYAPHLAFWIVHEAGMQVGAPIFHTGGGKVLGSERILALIKAYRATVLVGVPGYVYHLLRLATEKQLDFSNVRLVILGAERVTWGLKQKLHAMLETLGAKNPQILSTFGFTEARTAWIECPTDKFLTESTGYHTFPDLEIFELVDPDTGEQVGEGEPGEIVYSALDWRGSVVLRYKTGDYVKGGIRYGKCPGCGSMVPRIDTNITRMTDREELQLSNIKGTLVDFNEFFPIMSELKEVVEWQVEITKRNEDVNDLDEIHIYTAVTTKCDTGVLINEIEEKMHASMELHPAGIHFLSAEEMAERLGMDQVPKEKRIYDKRPELENEEK